MKTGYELSGIYKENIRVNIFGGEIDKCSKVSKGVGYTNNQEALPLPS